MARKSYEELYEDADMLLPQNRFFTRSPIETSPSTVDQRNNVHEGADTAPYLDIAALERYEQARAGQIAVQGSVEQ